MTSDRRVLLDALGTLAPIVDGLHDVAAAFEGRRRFAVVGGIAVLTHVQGHRVTHDIDTAVTGLKPDIHDDLLVVAEPARHIEADAVVANGVPVDVLVGALHPPRRGLGRRREVKAHAIRWAIETASTRRVVCEPVNPRGVVTLPIAGASALIAMKTISMTDPRRGAKATTDLLDLWLLLSADPDRGTQALQELGNAPRQLRVWTAEVLTRCVRDDPAGLVSQMVDAGASRITIADVRDIWEAVVEPHMAALSE